MLRIKFLLIVHILHSELKNTLIYHLLFCCFYSLVFS